MNDADQRLALDAQAWQRIGAAVDDAGNALRYPVFCTTDAGGQPQARHLVVRDVRVDLRTLIFHTEISSAKWSELADNPKATVLAYQPSARLQLRWRGTATGYAPRTPINQAAWDQLGQRIRQTYASRDSFAVISFRAHELDWFEHPGTGLRRALFRYDANGAVVQSDWVAP